MRVKNEEGQAIVLVALAMSIFLLGAVGLAVDGSHLYSQRQMAQTAADSAAIAGIMSVFDGTNGAGATAFTATQGTSFTCTSKPSSTPCQYASKDGFALSSDTVTVSFPLDGAAPGVSFSGDPTHLIQVTVQRSVKTTLMRLLGPTATTVQATAMAAIVSVVAPVPILVTHPTLTGSFSMNGGIYVQICGGPSRSIQVNSGATAAASVSGKSGTIDLSKAGPPDPGDCTTGTGADFGIWGGPATVPFTYLPGTTGKYIEPASPILDPLAGVSPPTDPGFAGTQTSGIAGGTDGCPSGQTCTLYSPGDYPNGFDGKLQNVLFKPGIYYVQNGFTCSANCNLYMATGFTDTGAGTTGTGWTGNMLVYNTGSTPCKKSAVSAYCPINLSANGNISLVGSPSGSSYDGILFFQDRSSPALSHTLGGNGAMTLLGTIYLNNTLALMQAGTGTQYQALSLQGTPGNSTLIEGEIIVGTLSLGGNATITMNLNSNSVLAIRQVALVN